MKTDQKRGNKNKIIFIIAALLLAVAAMFALFGKKGTAEEQEPAKEQENQAIEGSIEWKGKQYVCNPGFIHILFLGIDQSRPLKDPAVPGEAGQADSVILLSLNQETKQGHLLQINRNTMTNLDVYDRYGNYLKSIDGQLTLQYAYDIGGESSSRAMKKTVGELLYGLEIDGYFTMSMDGIAAVSDALGGVDMTLKQDYTEIDPSFTQGAAVHLTGAQAERFVRYRDNEKFNSVQGRMERQAEYVTAMIAKMRQLSAAKAYELLSPYMGEQILTDLKLEELYAMANYEYLTDEVQYLPGEMRQGEIYEEFYVDEEALQDLLISTFYQEAE